MEKKIIEWFNKTGYPFELWAEALFSKYGFSVESGHLYEDQESDETRELDLVATIGWTSKKQRMDFGLNLLVECKKSDKPFIILRSTNSTKPEVNVGSYYNVQDMPLGAYYFVNSNSRIPLPGRSSSGFKLVQGFVTGDETPNKAAYTLIKSFNAWRKIELDDVGSYIKDNYNSLTLPLLVVDAPLFELSIDQSGEVRLQRIDSGIVDHLSHLSRAPHTPFPIPVIQKAALETYIASVLQYGKSQFNILMANPKAQIRNSPKVELGFAPKQKTKSGAKSKK